MDTKELMAQLLEIAKDNEWQSRNAAENNYCPYCVTDDERWTDQVAHHDGCKFVAVVDAAEKYLANDTH